MRLFRDLPTACVLTDIMMLRIWGQHPDQLVTGMTLALDPDGPVARGSSTLDRGRIKVPFDFKIAMTKRGDNNLYFQEGYVENKDGAYRGVVECDGGVFVLRTASSG
jgi:hypothetical protein